MLRNVLRRRDMPDSGGLRGGDDSKKLVYLLPSCCTIGTSALEPSVPDLTKSTRPRHSNKSVDCTTAILFCHTSSSAMRLSLVPISPISDFCRSFMLSSSMTVLCHNWSYMVRKLLSSSMTVLLRWSRNFSVLASCLFSTFMKASRRARDCSSMY